MSIKKNLREGLLDYFNGNKEREHQAKPKYDITDLYLKLRRFLDELNKSEFGGDLTYDPKKWYSDAWEVYLFYKGVKIGAIVMMNTNEFSYLGSNPYKWGVAATDFDNLRELILDRFKYTKQREWLFQDNE
jgi:hypothetical protein